MLSSYLKEAVFREGKLKSVDFHWEFEQTPLLPLLEEIETDLALRWIDRFSVWESISAEWALAQAIENSLKQELSPRAEAIRVLASEIQRVLWGFQYFKNIFQVVEDEFRIQNAIHAIEEIFHHQDVFWGGRCHPQVICIGGVRKDLSVGEVQKMKELIAFLKKKIERVLLDLEGEPIIKGHFLSGLFIDKERAENLQFTGPMAQASGLVEDLRMNSQYGFYEKIKVEAYKPDCSGTSWARLQSVLFQMRQSCRIVEEILPILPKGEFRKDIKKVDLKTVRGEGIVEAPSGGLKVKVEKGRISIESYSTILRDKIAGVLLGLSCDDFESSFLSLGFDPCQGGVEW